MTNRILRWGLLSTAQINRVLIPPLRASKRNELVAVASRSIERAEEYAAEWKIPHAFGSYEALLARSDIDVIYNSLPNALHAEWTIKAAQAGKHVLCEKPLAMSVHEVDAISAAARQASVVVSEAFMYRHHPQTIKLKELVDDGAIGTLRFLRGSFTYPLNPEGNVRLDAALGGGCIWDVGCYPISYVRYVVGSEPLEVFGWQMIGSTGVDEAFVGQMRFGDDIIAQFDSSFHAQFRTQIEIVGSAGVLSVSHPYKPGLEEEIVITRDYDAQTVKVPGQELYSGEVEDMADAIMSDTAPRISLADSRANVAVIDALLRSARAGRLQAVA